MKINRQIAWLAASGAMINRRALRIPHSRRDTFPHSALRHALRHHRLDRFNPNEVASTTEGTETPSGRHGKRSAKMGFALNDRHSPTIYGQRIRFAGRWLMDSAKFLFPIILPCPAKRVSVSSVVHDSRTATCTPRKPPTVMKYHAEDTSTLNGPRWFNRFRVGRGEPDVASFGRAVSMKPPWVPTRIVLSFLNHVFRFACLTLTSICDTIYVVFKQGEEYVTG